MILFQTLDIRCLVVYNITFLLLVFFTFESALYVAVCSVKLSRSCGNRLLLQSLSSCLLFFVFFFPSLILIWLEYHGAAGRTVTVRVESGVWKSNILRSSELYKSTLRDMSTRSTINNAIRIPEFQQALRSCCTRRRAAIETEQIEKKSVALRTPVITLRILGVDPLACKKSLKGEEMTPGIDTT